MYKKYIKRTIDIVLSFMVLIILSPVFVILGIVIKIDSNGPVIFRQKRIGRNMSHFYILKFRTMKTDSPKDMPTHLLKNPNEFATKAGKFLRKTSLDELPQLINILKGEMSFVGPRPALWNQFDLTEERDKYGANNILPGLTGWAQVRGRDELSIADKAKYDGEYVKKMSLLFDISICFKTVCRVIRSDGVVEGQVRKK